MEKNDYWLIGLRIDPDKELSDFYTIIITGEKDKAILVDEKILFSSYINNLYMAAQQYGYSFIDVKHKVDGVCDIADLLYLINNESIDNNAVIINSINLLLDLVYSTEIAIPDSFKDCLYETADYFTFNREFEPLFAKGISREEITNSILWCVGCIFSNSKWIMGAVSNEQLNEN